MLQRSETGGWHRRVRVCVWECTCVWACTPVVSAGLRGRASVRGPCVCVWECVWQVHPRGPWAESRAAPAGPAVVGVGGKTVPEMTGNRSVAAIGRESAVSISADRPRAAPRPHPPVPPSFLSRWPPCSAAHTRLLARAPSLCGLPVPPDWPLPRKQGWIVPKVLSLMLCPDGTGAKWVILSFLRATLKKGTGKGEVVFNNTFVKPHTFETLPFQSAWTEVAISIRKTIR